MFNKQILALVLGLGVVVLVGWFLGFGPQGAPDHPSKPNELLAFDFVEGRVPLPQTPFLNKEGEVLRIADFKGKVLVVNLWATWCAPCVEEMPTLDLLQRDMADKPVEVLAISLDADGPDKVQSFFELNGIAHLDLYNDATMGFYAEVKAPGLPITLIVSPEGEVIGQLAGTAHWNAPAVQEFLLALAAPAAREP